MAAGGLTMDQPERVGNRFEALDSPIAWVGLHLIENLRGQSHSDMILQVTLCCNAQFDGELLSSIGSPSGRANRLTWTTFRYIRVMAGAKRLHDRFKASGAIDGARFYAVVESSVSPRTVGVKESQDCRCD